MDKRKTCGYPMITRSQREAFIYRK